MKKKLELLTPEQEELMVTIKDKWINQLFDLKEINIPQLTEGINWLYTFCKLEKPNIIICKSILEAQLTIHALKNISGIETNVWANVGANVLANVRANVWANVRANVLANVGANVRANVWDNVGANVGAKNFKFEQLCSYGDINDYGWVSFYDFFTQINIINNPDFNNFLKLIQSNYYSMIQLEKTCIVIENPQHIILNLQKQMHSLDDYAFKFKDNTGMYFVNGIYVSDELFNQLKNKKYSFEQWTKETNEEIKSLVLAYYEEAFGGEFVFRFLSTHLKEIDTYVDKKPEQYLENTTKGMNIGVYTLFKGQVNNLDIAYIRCYCPSTDRMFFLGVHESMTNAKDAIASLCQIPVKLKANLLSIRRQGEAYSFNFDKKGTNLLKTNSLTTADLQNVVSLSGDEYFSKIQWEY